jgi:hypothetical protein
MMDLKALRKDDEPVRKAAIKPRVERRNSARRATPTQSGVIAKKLNIKQRRSDAKIPGSKVYRAPKIEEPEKAEHPKYESATIMRRAVALIIDYVIITLLFAPLLYIQLLDSSMLLRPAETIMYSSLLALVGIAYAAVFMIMYQQTFGMMFAKIHVPQAETPDEKKGIIKYSTLYAGLFIFWILSIISPIAMLLVWVVIFAELISYRIIGDRTMFEMLGNITVLQERRITNG